MSDLFKDVENIDNISSENIFYYYVNRFVNYFNTYGELENNTIGFIKNGIHIIDPFRDETMRFEVNPEEYYGKYQYNTFVKEIMDFAVLDQVNKMKVNFEEAAKVFELYNSWDFYTDVNDLISEKYPFDASFDTFIQKIDEWTISVADKFRNPFICDKYKSFLFNEDFDSKFELYLVTDKFVYYVNENESDENRCTLMFDLDMNLISENYFAYESLYEESVKYQDKNSFSYISDICSRDFEYLYKVNKKEIEKSIDYLQQFDEIKCWPKDKLVALDAFLKRNPDIVAGEVIFVISIRERFEKFYQEQSKSLENQITDAEKIYEEKEIPKREFRVQHNELEY